MDIIGLQLAALSDPTRRALVSRLAAGEATVSELRKPFKISQPAISKHLKVLERAGLIACGQAAQARPRRLKPEALKATADWIAEMRALWPDSFDRLDALLQSIDTDQGPTHDIE